MKAFFCSILLFSAITLSSFQDTVEIKNIITSLKQGNAAQLSPNFYRKVRVYMPGVNDFYSAQKTSLMMQHFFAKHKVTAFVVSKIERTDNGSIITGSLQTKTAAFEVWIGTTNISAVEQIAAINFFPVK